MRECVMRAPESEKENVHDAMVARMVESFKRLSSTPGATPAKTGGETVFSRIATNEQRATIRGGALRGISKKTPQKTSPKRVLKDSRNTMPAASPRDGLAMWASFANNGTPVKSRVPPPTPASARAKRTPMSCSRKDDLVAAAVKFASLQHPSVEHTPGQVFTKKDLDAQIAEEASAVVSSPQASPHVATRLVYHSPPPNQSCIAPNLKPATPAVANSSPQRLEKQYVCLCPPCPTEAVLAAFDESPASAAVLQISPSKPVGTVASAHRRQGSDPVARFLVNAAFDALNDSSELLSPPDLKPTFAPSFHDGVVHVMPRKLFA